MKNFIKIAAILTIFMVTLVVGTGIATSLLSRKLPDVKKMVAKIVPESFYEKPLFYKTIGGNSPGDADGAVSERTDKSQASMYTVEVLVTTKKRRASDLVKQLKAQGIKGYYTSYNNNGRIFYKVRTGLFRTKKHAERHRHAIMSKRYTGVKVRAL